MIRRNDSTMLTILAALGAIGVMVNVATAQGTPSTLVPPNTTGTISPPLTTANTTQAKNGPLGVAKLCLNASNQSDTTNCISTWADLTDQLPDYVRVRSTAYSVLPADQQGNYVQALDLGVYTSQPRRASLQALYTNATNFQLAAAYIKAPNVNICLPDESAGAYFCYGDSHFAQCQSNSDCLVNSTAVSATGGSTALSGNFLGTVYVRGAAATTFSPYGRICLNGLESVTNDAPGGSCISSWNEVAAGTTLYVKRQLGYSVAPQSLGAAISGDAAFGGAILGSSTGIDWHYTCGDGICNSTETVGLCPIDCQQVTSPSITSSVTLSSYTNPTITLRPTISSQTGAARVLVVRSTTTSPAFRPVNGYVYAAGQTYGTEYTVYSSVVAQSGTPTQLTINDNVPLGAAPRPTYYYSVYVGNAYPTYLAPVTTSVKLGLATVNKTAATTSIIGNAGAAYSCAGTVCRGLYNIAAGSFNDTIYPTSQDGGYTPNGWTGCDTSTASTCTFVLSGTDRSFTFDEVPVGGGGGGGDGGGGVDGGGDPGVIIH